MMPRYEGTVSMTVENFGEIEVDEDIPEHEVREKLRDKLAGEIDSKLGMQFEGFHAELLSFSEVG